MIPNPIEPANKFARNTFAFVLGHCNENKLVATQAPNNRIIASCFLSAAAI